AGDELPAQIGDHPQPNHQAGDKHGKRGGQRGRSALPGILHRVFEGRHAIRTSGCWLWPSLVAEKSKCPVEVTPRPRPKRPASLRPPLRLFAILMTKG